jgi:hypothetical protein
MEKFYLMSLLFIFNYIGLLIAISSGKFFLKLINNSYNKYLSTLETGLFGFVFLGIFAVLINFFFSINLYITTLFSIFFVIFTYKDYKLSCLIKIFYTCVVATILLAIANNNRPDGGLYHLPFIQMLNENKIIVGAVNINFRFGLNSIWQYASSFYNNFLFGKIGITIPNALVCSLFFIFLLEKINFEINNRKKKRVLIIIFLFFVLMTSLYSFSNYSNYGNDVPVHIYYFYLIYLLVNSRFYEKLFLITISCFITLFIIFNKLFFILASLVPLYFIFKYKKFSFFKSKIFLLILFIVAFIFLKNVLMSGCILYPVSFTCIKNLTWLNFDQVTNQALEGEAWAKAWIDQKDIKDFSTYSKNLNWLSTWINSHFKVVIEKFAPILIFFIIFLITSIFSGKKNSQKIYFSELSNFNFLFFLSLLNLFFWFFKFPIYRYGYAFILIFSISIFFIFFSVFLKKINTSNLKRNIYFFVVISFSLLIIKNLNRIISDYNLNYSFYPWPNLVSGNRNNIAPVVKKVFVGENYYYQSLDPDLCWYFMAPCTNYEIKNLDSNTIFSYKIFYIR